ncbi:HNH endonuclease signature motif containing protein [Acinetobacter higginsii]|uniref:HNH endonuclease signature motif containing protein n=1 Tax=Acinetobacter higginsii TaxID=70347 RepID=UPI0026771F4F|nr:HNH endonuclease signature motif containing protein [Acinetobacter higginsii]MDO3665302.1 HNH endonuclease signature motif containing protein [Acinetobacter higginsii]
MPRGQAIKYTPEQLDFIKSNCSLGRNELTAKVNLKFNKNFTVDQIKSLCTRNKWKTGRTGCFEKGDKPWNTGTKGLVKPNTGNFRSGQVAWNKKPIGYERICSKDGYVIIKIAEPSEFAHKHRVVWEKAYGPIPDGQVVAFKNMDKTDCRLENLILMTKAEMVRYSQSFHKLANSTTNETCLLMAKVKSKTHQVIKGGASC